MLTQLTIVHVPGCPHAGLACRTYATEADIEGAPSVRQIVEALRSARGN